MSSVTHQKASRMKRTSQGRVPKKIKNCIVAVVVGLFCFFNLDYAIADISRNFLLYVHLIWFCKF